MDTPTAIRGHLAARGSPAEAYLVAFGEVLNGVPDLAAIRNTLSAQHARERERTATIPPHLHVQGPDYVLYRVYVTGLEERLVAAQERRAIASTLLQMAKGASGYLGQEDIALRQG